MQKKPKILALIAISLYSLCLFAKDYTVPATAETITLGLFTLNKTPVVKIQSGDTVTMETWNSCLHEMVFNKTTPADVAKFYMKHGIQKKRGMHSLTGPVYVEGAEPGDVLEVRILDIRLTDWGYNFLSTTAGILTEFTEPQIKYFKFDKKNNTTEFSKGVCLKLKPFPGIIAVAPPLDWPEGWPVNLQAQMGQPESGEFNSVPPGPFGGNLDAPSLQAGSILYLPVFQKGALLWTGDSHAMQSNGEIDVTALETAYEGITFQLILRKDLKAEGVLDKSKRNGADFLSWPVIENESDWMIAGLHENLFQAMQLASKNAINFLARIQGVSPHDGYQFLSMVGDFEIIEAVNGVKNVTVRIPKNMFRGNGHRSTLSAAGKFPLKTPASNQNPVCVPQEGITVKNPEVK